MKQHNLHEVMQSAYKQLHSTETALVRVQNDILTSMDNKRGVILVLLDLSAAFDTIDHGKLLKQLELRLGVKETALEWFSSYLSGRTQSVCVESEYSTPVTLKYGVPQGSVLGPLLYTIYTLPLGDILRDANISFHLYADDTQLYLSFDFNDPSSQEECLQKVQLCVAKIKQWMTANKLKLNGDKTEVLYISSKYYQDKINIGDFKVDDTPITPAAKARNIGVYFDSTMSMQSHVTAICQAAHLQLRNIGRIRKSVSFEATEKLVHAFVTSRLDCCNAMLYGLPVAQIKRLQHMLHIAARILSITPSSASVTPVLKNLHWLPVTQRIQYKILLLTFKALHGFAPSYLSELLQWETKETSMTTRSTNTNRLKPKTTRTKTFGERSFSAAAPFLWNDLPPKIRSIHKIEPFKSELKTHLYKAAYKD